MELGEIHESKNRFGTTDRRKSIDINPPHVPYVFLLPVHTVKCLNFTVLTDVCAKFHTRKTFFVHWFGFLTPNFPRLHVTNKRITYTSYKARRWAAFCSRLWRVFCSSPFKRAREALLFSVWTVGVCKPFTKINEARLYDNTVYDGYEHSLVVYVY